MTRNGKIARLPKAIRDQLNRRLEDGQPGVRVVEWLNTLPEVHTVLTEQFDGRAINEVNLSEWKAGGFLDWQARQEMLAHTQELVEEAFTKQLKGLRMLCQDVAVLRQFLGRWAGEGYGDEPSPPRRLEPSMAGARKGLF